MQLLEELIHFQKIRVPSKYIQYELSRHINVLTSFGCLPNYFLMHFTSHQNLLTHLRPYIYIYMYVCIYMYTFPGDSDSKECACNAGDLGLIPGFGRAPGEGNGNPLQHSLWRILMENSIDKGTWWSAVQESQRAGHDYVRIQREYIDYTVLCIL